MGFCFELKRRQRFWRSPGESKMQVIQREKSLGGAEVRLLVRWFVARVAKERGPDQQLPLVIAMLTRDVQENIALTESPFRTRTKGEG